MSKTVGSRGNGPSTRRERSVERRYPSADGAPPWEARELPFDPAIIGFLIRDGSSGVAWSDDTEGSQWTDRGRAHARRRGVGLAAATPRNEYQALMEAPPGSAPKTHSAQLLDIREALADAIEALPSLDRHIFEGYFTRRQSLATIGKRMGWNRMRVMRNRDRIVRQLRVALADHPAIAAYLASRERATPTVTPPVQDRPLEKDEVDE